MKRSLSLCELNLGLTIVTSGYRCEALNFAVRGVANSHHLSGQALDIVVSGVPPLEICQWYADRLHIPFDQAIQEGRWAHISWAENPHQQTLTAHFDPSGIVTYTRGEV